MPPETAAVIIAIASTFGPGLVQIAASVVDRAAVEPLLRGKTQRLSQWLSRRSEQAQRDERLRQAVQRAFAAIGAPQGEQDFDGWALRLGFDKLQASSEAGAELRELLTRTALLMRAPQAREIPERIYNELRWPHEHRPILAQFLYALRQELANDRDWGPLMEMGNDEIVRGYLAQATTSLAAVETYLKALLDFHGITATDEQTALREYIAFVEEKHRRLSFVFIKPAGGRDNLLTEADLETVFVPLQLHDPRRLPGEEAGGRGAARRTRPGANPPGEPRDRPSAIEEVLSEYPAFLLRGAPGSGKTTLLRHLALSFARGRAAAELGWTGDPLLPILVPLRNFGYHLQEHPLTTVGPAPLRDFIETHFAKQDIDLPPDFFRKRLKMGHCLLLLDGLDEVADRDVRAQVAQVVMAFVRHYAPRGNRFVVASREKGYEEVARYLPAQEMLVCDVLPLIPEERDRLVGGLLRQFGGSSRQQQEEIDDLLQHIHDKERLDDLSSNPLFCTTLVLVYKYRGATLPERRVDIYGELINLMLGFWDLSRVNRGEDTVGVRELALLTGTALAFEDEDEAVDMKERALIHLADWMQGRGSAEIPRADVLTELARYFEETEGANPEDTQEWAKGYLSIAHQRSGLFIEVNPDTYAFSHKSFLEYLAATALVEKPEEEWRQLLADHAGDEWWHEVIRLAAAHTGLGTSPSRRIRFFDTLLEAGHTVLAGHCAVDAGGRLPKPIRETVISRLYTRMTDTALSPAERYAAADPWDALHGPPDDVNAWVRCPACGDGKQDLYVGKYPVTNAQYALFVAAGGYEESRWWGGEDSKDWAWRTRRHPGYRGEDAVSQPEYWRHSRFGKSRRGYPVVGVSWYEAVAYCAWLTDLLARARHEDTGLSEAERALVADLLTAGVQAVRLPGDREWVRLAGGDQGGRYPWDRPRHTTDWQRDILNVAGRANVGEPRLQGTTPVGMYPAGVSHPFELHELAGNVCEWTSGFSLRGGSWVDDADLARVSARRDDDPFVSSDNVGIRVVSPVVLVTGS